MRPQAFSYNARRRMPGGHRGKVGSYTMTAIQRNSPVPRYYQLKEILQERVRSGEWQPGNLIPFQPGALRLVVKQASGVMARAAND